MKILPFLALVLTSVAPAFVGATDDALLFADDFATLRPGWGKADETRSVSGNKLIESVGPNLLRINIYDGLAVGNVGIRLNVAQMEGNTDQLGGLIFWAANYENFYIARVTADGNFAVGRRMNGKWLFPVSYQPSEELRKGLGQANGLRVVTSGRVATVFINEKQVAELQGFPPPGESKFGVYAEAGDLPSKWAFSGLSIHPGPSPAPEAATNAGDTSTLILSDNFATWNPSWGRQDNDRGVVNNKLITSLKPELSRHIFFEGALLENADIRMTVSQLEGNLDCFGGLVFWAQNHDNYYTARFTSDGNIAVARRMNGKSLYPVAYQPQEALHQGLNQENVLRIVTSGRTATVYVNDKQVVQLPGYPPQGGSKFGIYAESDDLPAKWAFSQLFVQQGPAPSPDETSSTDRSLLMADDFKTMDPAWGPAGDNRNVQDNKLWIKLKPDRRLISFYEGRLFDDVDFSVKVSSEGRWSDQLPGLVFWGNGFKDYCAFAIDPEGGDIYAGQILEGKWKGMNILTKAKSKMRKKGNEINELRVLTTGDSATLYINGQKAHSYKGKPPEGGSRIGLFMETNEDPITCGFSELRVRTPLVTPETSANRTDGLLLTDDFRVLHPTWGSANQFQAVSDNRLLLSPSTRATTANFYSGNFGDVDLRVRITLAKGLPNLPSGAAFWQTDGEHYYVALLRPDGYVSVVRRFEGLWLYPVPNRLCEAVRQGPGQTNDLRVVTCGSSASVYVNDKPALSFRGFPPPGGGGVGLFGESGPEQCTWAFSDLTVHKGPESPATAGPRDAAMLFADDFSVLDLAWTDPNKLLSLGEHKLVMQPNPDLGYTTLYGGALFSDADLRVKISLTAGQANRGAGIVFWASNFENYFLATIRADGRLDVARNKEGKFTPLIQPKNVDAVLQGTGQSNELRVFTQGKAATIHVNGTQVASVETDAVPKPGWKLGLHAASGKESSSWSFSDLVVQPAR